MAGQNPFLPQLPLLERARTLVQPGRLRDTVHIMLAALLHPHEAGAASEVLGHLDEPTRNRLYTGLKTYSDLASEVLPFGETDNRTDRLRQCEERWQNQARLSTIGLTSALVLGIIVANDNVVRGILTNSGIDPNQLYRALEPKFAIPDGPLSPWTPQPDPLNQFNQVNQPTWPPPYEISGQWAMRAIQKANELAKPVGPSQLRAFRDMHPVAMTNFLSVLSASVTSQEVPIAVGHRGSPVGHLDQVLADRIGMGERFVGAQEPLNRYKGVCRLDARVMLMLATASGSGVTEPEPDKVFEQVKLLMQQREVILVVDHIEAWRGAGATLEALRAQLGNRGGALLCGIYMATDEPNVIAEATLGLPNATLVRVNTYNVEETRDFLKRFYTDYWAGSGFILADDAFSSIYILEPGCWINLKRMTLPYLAVSMAEQAIQMAMRGEDSIRQTIREAQDALKHLMQDEWPRATEEVRSTYQHVLRQVQDDLNHLTNNPAPKTQGQFNRRVLTRGHIVAQLFAPNESEFHLPGFRPSMV